MLKKITSLSLVFISLFFAKTEANSYSNLSCNSCCDAEWIFYGDWLYWKARRSRLDYAIPVTEEEERQVGEVYRIQPSYKSGFRVGFLYEYDPIFYDLFYTRFHHTYSNTATDVLTTELSRGGLFNRIEAMWSLSYDTIDLLLGFAKNRCLCIEHYFFAGLKFAFIDQKFTSNNFVITDGEVFLLNYIQKINMHSYGVNVGIDAVYDFWHYFNFFGRCSIDFLLGNFSRSYFNDNFGVENDLNDHFWNMVTAVNLLFGINYIHSFSDCWYRNIGLSIGYEFHQYFGMPDYMSFSRSSGLFIHDLQNLSLDGLFMRFSLGF